jgi:hypothetical protein
MDSGPARSSPKLAASMARGIAPAMRAARPISEYACWRKAGPETVGPAQRILCRCPGSLGIAREQPNQGGLDIQSEALLIVALECLDCRLDLPCGLLQLALYQQGPENGQLDRVFAVKRPGSARATGGPSPLHRGGDLTAASPPPALS